MIAIRKMAIQKTAMEKITRKPEKESVSIIFYAMFISVFSVVMILANYYILHRIASLLAIGAPLFYIALALGFSLPLSLFFEKRAPNIITWIFYTASSIWLGLTAMLFFFVVSFDIANLFLSMPAYESGLAIIILTIILGTYSIVNAQFITIKKVNIPFGKLKTKKAKKARRFVQLSDIHMGTIRNLSFLMRIVNKTNELKPDFVVITGDLVDGSAPLRGHMFDALNKISCPVFYVTGNHEFYEGFSYVYDLLKSTKLRILDGEMIEYDGIQIIGCGYSMAKNHLKNALEKLKIDDTKPSILLYHVPTEINAAVAKKISLMLSGHTHNGQIFPFNILVKLAFRHAYGLRKYDDTNVYVSCGTGTWGPPMRLGSRNEITVFELQG